ncbi:MAG: DUF4338 domain-containing protein [Chloroflexi bacterium]|nr:DUF4338 domain-containing protein [Chloroflexota bacterium]
MEKIMTIQGRETTHGDIKLVQRLIQDKPSWNRTRLSRELCLLWNWRASNGRAKDMACRTLLSKLEQRGHITLPRRQTPGRGCGKVCIPCVPHKTEPIACALSALAPIHVELVEEASLLDLFKCLLSRYHYLGFGRTVGENMKYLVLDREHNPLACLLFGSAAWKCAPRDDFIGWDANTRKVLSHFKWVTQLWNSRVSR